MPRLASAGAAATLALAACGGGKPIPFVPPTTTTVAPAVVELEPARPVGAAVVDRTVAVLHRRLDLAGATGTVSAVTGGIEARVDAGPGQGRALAVITRTGRVLFRPVVMPRDVGDCPATNPDRESPARPAVLVEQRSGHTVTWLLALCRLVIDTAQATQEPADASWQVELSFTTAGSGAFDAMAARYIGRQIAIELDAVVLSAPAVQTAEFGGRAIVRPFGDEEEARQLASLLGSGALPVPLRARSAP